MFLADPIPSDTKLTPDQQKLILGGEICMWGEQIHAETVDSRVWPRSMAIAERFWSAQSDRNVDGMYRRLRAASLELEDVGLTHISGPQKLRRSLWDSAEPLPLEVLVSVIEPVSFGERYQGQHTDALTSLDRLVDAVVPDPPARQEIAREVDALFAADDSGQRVAAAMRLRRRFTQWEEAAPQVEALAARSPRLNDAGVRAHQLGALAALGLESLAYLESGSAPLAGWNDTESAAIADAEKPSALVRFVFLPAMHKLVEAAAGAAKSNVANAGAD
jgi:hexosaminidase